MGALREDVVCVGVMGTGGPAPKQGQADLGLPGDRQKKSLTPTF